MNDVEELLSQALLERTATATGRADSLQRLQAQLNPGRRRALKGRLVVLAATTASVAAVLVVALIASGFTEGGGSQTGAFAGSGLSSGPWPADRHFIATSMGAAVIADAETAQVIAALPSVGGAPLDGPVLSPDGERVYGTWGDRSQHVGYLDVQTGRFVTLETRAGSLVSATLSADGSTLAYEWLSDPSSPATGTKLVTLRLSDGAVNLVDTLYAGPQMLPMALSPDGKTLAVVPTNNNGEARTLLIQPAGAGTSAHMVESTCPDERGSFDQPRWTTSGLFAYERCFTADGSPTSGSIVKVDVATGKATVLHRLGWTGTTRIAAVERDGHLLFAASNEAQPGSSTVEILDPAGAWTSRQLKDVDGLAVIAAQ